ncbi:hypothetical protein [Cyclobacterium qasimii]|uniref:Small multi-drug export protein n=2 Tax=Cyclobacterium qasimii TaxID=1350429 RepID=S7VHE3_9BACT|nr:hypothetical protein [Cyclobacterium qasimii]EPR68957.1 hypothetical protein ADICYQ_2044 [Cyclobacterium qasimii M12-11B]GEO23907.1 hypothetical protein CQA01_44410 [Cyclobacterium qasimii]
MIEYLITFAGIYFLCLFKFVAGPLLGAAAGYSLLEIVVVTVSGMMTSVVLFTYLGDWFMRNWNVLISKKPKRFTKRTRNVIKVWKKFGIWGIALLTPLILTPIGGTVVLTSFGIAKKKILLTMFVSALVWAFAFGLSIEELLKIPFLKNLLT